MDVRASVRPVSVPSRVVPLPLAPLRTHPLRPTTAVWAAGSFLFAYDCAKGAWELARKEAHGEAIRTLDAEVPSGAAAGATRWISSGDDKEVRVWDERDGSWELAASLKHGKKVTVAILDGAGNGLFADRFGDVYRWGLREDAEARLLLSHLAIVTAMVLTESRKFLITGDNHERIRVSCYPLAEEIHSFCLGHTGQITAVAPRGDEALVTASADGTLRLWNMDGTPAAALKLGSEVICLGGLLSDDAVVGCEAAPGLRRVRLAAGADANVPSPPTSFETLAEEAPQAVCVRPGDGAILWVDRRGHLRLPPAAAGGAWGDIFEGEDVPANLAVLAKNANWGDAGEADEDGDGDADGEGQKPGKKRRHKT